MSDLVLDRVAQEGELLQVRCDVGEQAKDVFCVQLATGKGASDIDAALDIVREDGRVDGFGL